MTPYLKEGGKVGFGKPFKHRVPMNSVVQFLVNRNGEVSVLREEPVA